MVQHGVAAVAIFRCLIFAGCGVFWKPKKLLSADDMFNPGGFFEICLYGKFQQTLIGRCHPQDVGVSHYLLPKF
jgi:hypothetical protein